MSRAARIVGVGTTEFYKRGRSPFSAHHLALRAIMNAAADACIDVRSIDGLFSYTHEPVLAGAVVDSLGLDGFRYSAQPLDNSGGGTTQALQLAVDAVESGRVEVAAVYKAMRQSEHRYGRPGGYLGLTPAAGRVVHHEPVFSMALSGSFASPFGASVPVHHYAMQTRRHMHLYGTTTEHFGMVAKTIRDHASRNPAAVFQEPIDLADHQNSRMISSPLRLLDCCMENDGAGAVIVTTADRAKDLPHPGVQVLASAYGTDRDWSTMHGFDPYPSANFSNLAKRLYSEAGLGPSGIDTAQLYDHFTSYVIIALEQFGFCEIGGGGEFVASGAIAWPNGSIPVNTSGGMLSEVYLIAMNLLIEGVRQIRGESTCQVAGAKTALVTSGAGAMPTGAVILAAA